MVSLMAWHKSTVSSETPGKAWSFPSSIGKRIRTCLKVIQPPDVDHKTRVLGRPWEWLGAYLLGKIEHRYSRFDAQEA